MAQLEQWFLLLTNIEEHLLYLQNFNEERKYLSDPIDTDRALELLNIDTPYNLPLIKQYYDVYGIYSKDIDILNLILKYIVTSGKIINFKNKNNYGVKQLNYHPSFDIPYLEEDYFNQKFKQNKTHYMFRQYSLMLDLSLRILIPFTIRYGMSIYNDIP